MGHSLVVVAVQDRLGAEAADRRLEGARVGQAAQRRPAARQRRVVDEDDARQILGSGFLQDRRQRLDLARAEPAGRHQRPGRRRRAEADQRDVAPHPHERKRLAARIFGVARVHGVNAAASWGIASRT